MTERVGRETNVGGPSGLDVPVDVDESDEMQRYSRSDVDVGLFPVPPVHLPLAPPPTPLSPPMAYVGDAHDDSDAAHDKEGNVGGVVHPRAEGVGTRHGMTSRWSVASSIDEAEGATEGKKNAKEKEKEKEKEKRKSFVAIIAAVAGGTSSNADSGVGVGAGGLDVPSASGSGENLMLSSKDKDPKEKKRGRLASFISRLSYSGASASVLVSPGMFFFLPVFVFSYPFRDANSIRGTSAPPAYANNVNANYTSGVSDSGEDADVDVAEITICASEPEPV